MSIEITAKSVDDAVRQAASQLGVDTERVAVEVLEESKGLFGKSQVRVRASVADTAPKAKAKAVKTAEKPAKEAKPEKPVKPEPAPKPEKPTAKPARGSAKPEKAAKPAKPEAKVEADDEGGPDRPDVVATQADAEQLAEMVREILDLADLQVVVDISELNGRYVNLELDGKDVGFLIGKQGEVLNAFQYLMNVIAGRQLGNGVRVTLDGNHYRRRRAEALTNLAVQIAEQVRERGEEAVLDALPAFERRVVHHALSTMEGIATYSEGEEPNRRVVIAPAE